MSANAAQAIVFSVLIASLAAACTIDSVATRTANAQIEVAKIKCGAQP
jgi:hypothetical protein